MYEVMKSFISNAITTFIGLITLASVLGSFCLMVPLPQVLSASKVNKKAVLPQGNRAMPQVFFSVEVRQEHSLQV